MSKSAQIVQATCKYPAGQPRQGKYGEYISALFTAPECGDVRIFGDPTDDLLKSIKRGQKVWLIDNNRGGYKLAAAPAIDSTSGRWRSLNSGTIF
jgi:hypothetical protein